MLLFFAVDLFFCSLRVSKNTALQILLIGFFGILAYGEAASVKVRNMFVILIFESRHRKNKAISSHNLCMTLS